MRNGEYLVSLKTSIGGAGATSAKMEEDMVLTVHEITT
jgi:hypothetical protein